MTSPESRPPGLHRLLGSARVLRRFLLCAFAISLLGGVCSVRYRSSRVNAANYAVAFSGGDIYLNYDGPDWLLRFASEDFRSRIDSKFNDFDFGDQYYGVIMADWVICHWLQVREVDAGVPPVRFSDHLDVFADAAIVHMYGAQLQAEMLEPLTKLKSLERLFLQNSELDNSVVEVVSRCRGLKEVVLQNTNANDESVRLLAQLPHLSELNLIKTKVTSASSRSLSQMSELRVLHLTGTAVGEDIADVVCSMKSLESVGLPHAFPMPVARQMAERRPDLTVGVGPE